MNMTLFSSSDSVCCAIWIRRISNPHTLSKFLTWPHGPLRLAVFRMTAAKASLLAKNARNGAPGGASDLRLRASDLRQHKVPRLRSASPRSAQDDRWRGWFSIWRCLRPQTSDLRLWTSDLRQHKVLRLRSASPRFAQDDRWGRVVLDTASLCSG